MYIFLYNGVGGRKIGELEPLTLGEVIHSGERVVHTGEMGATSGSGTVYAMTAYPMPPYISVTTELTDITDITAMSDISVRTENQKEFARSVQTISPDTTKFEESRSVMKWVMEKGMEGCGRRLAWKMLGGRGMDNEKHNRVVETGFEMSLRGRQDVRVWVIKGSGVTDWGNITDKQVDEVMDSINQPCPPSALPVLPIV